MNPSKITTSDLKSQFLFINFKVLFIIGDEEGKIRDFTLEDAR